MTAFIGQPESLHERWDRAFLQLHSAIDQANREIWGSPQVIAGAGLAGAGSPLPHLERIQAAFGHHDVGGVRARVGGHAAQSAAALGADGYAMGNSVAFARQPDLFLAAHEAAHVVQQRGGVALSGGMGTRGDGYERHADEVAGLVVAGKSAESALDRVAPRGMTGGARKASVQRKENGKDPARLPWIEPEDDQDTDLENLREDELKALQKRLEGKDDAASRDLKKRVADRLLQLKHSRPKNELTPEQKTNSRKPEEKVHHYTKRPGDKGYVTKTRLDAGYRQLDVTSDKQLQDVDRDEKRRLTNNPSQSQLDEEQRKLEEERAQIKAKKGKRKRADSKRLQQIKRDLRKVERQRRNYDNDVKNTSRDKRKEISEDAKKKHRKVGTVVGGDLVKKGFVKEGSFLEEINQRLSSWLKRYNDDKTELSIKVLGYKLDAAGRVSVEKGLAAALEGGATLNLLEVAFARKLARAEAQLQDEKVSAELKVSASASVGGSVSGKLAADANGMLKKLKEAVGSGEKMTAEARRAQPKVDPKGSGDEALASVKGQLSGFVGAKGTIGLGGNVTWHKKNYAKYKASGALRAGFKRYVGPHLPEVLRQVLDEALRLGTKGEEAVVNFVLGGWGAQGNVALLEGNASVTGSAGFGAYGKFDLGFSKGGLKVDASVGVALGLGLGGAATIFINVVESAKLALIIGGRLLTWCLDHLKQRLEAYMPKLKVMIGFSGHLGDELHDAMKSLPMLNKLITGPTPKVGYRNEDEILEIEKWLEEHRTVLMGDPRFKKLVIDSSARRRTAIRIAEAAWFSELKREMQRYVERNTRDEGDRKVRRHARSGAPLPADAAALATAGFAGGGGELPYRRELEASFGQDLSHVRAHAGAPARRAGEALAAEAYAMGRDVAFTSPTPDKAVVAHEVTHALQQTGKTPRRLGDSDSAAEREADAVERAVASGRPAREILGRTQSVRPAPTHPARKTAKEPRRVPVLEHREPTHRIPAQVQAALRDLKFLGYAVEQAPKSDPPRWTVSREDAFGVVEVIGKDLDGAALEALAKRVRSAGKPGKELSARRLAKIGELLARHLAELNVLSPEEYESAKKSGMLQYFDKPNRKNAPNPYRGVAKTTKQTEKIVEYGGYLGMAVGAFIFGGTFVLASGIVDTGFALLGAARLGLSTTNLICNLFFAQPATPEYRRWLADRLLQPDITRPFLDRHGVPPWQRASILNAYRAALLRSR